MAADDRSRLTIRESTFPCGFGPRAIHLSQDRSAVFVGAKDGSIQGIKILSEKDGSTRYELSQVWRSGSGIRSLAEWQSGWLWVSRQGGELALLKTASLFNNGERSRGTPVALNSLHAGDTVRVLGGIDAARAFVSFERNGTWVLPREPAQDGDPAQALKRSLRKRIELRFQGRPLSGLSFGTLLEGLAKSRLVLANRRGEIFQWSGADGTVERTKLWAEGEQPAFLHHAAMLWSDLRKGERRKVRGIFLATDRGVFLVYPDGEDLRHVRVALPGLGAVCTMITYAEPGEPNGRCHLWAADSRGESHLYWAEPCEQPSQLSFRSCGISSAGRQAMLVESWRRSESCLVVAHVRRGNQIIFTEYHEAAARRRKDPDRLWLLNWGSERDIRSFWRKRDRTIAKWPAAAQLSELFEVLAEESAPLKPLLEFLADPAADAAWRILAKILRRDGARKACEAVELWTLSLLGIINRTGSELKDVHREAAYLGIVRWVSALQQRAAEAMERRVLPAQACREVIRDLDTSIGMIRKWGLFADIHGARESLVSPNAVLRDQDRALRRQEGKKQKKPEWSLERLTYEVLLFERGLDLRAENRGGNLPGRNAWDITVCRLWDRTFIAVSWHWGGVELFELRQEAGQALELDLQLGIEPVSISPDTYRFRPLSGKEIVERNEDRQRRIQRSPYGHSRAVLLGALPAGNKPRGYLVTAPALPPESKAWERLQLWELVSNGGKLGVRSRRPKTLSLKKEKESESVYSLLDLGSGFGIAGLRSTGGEAACLLFQVTASDGSLSLREIDIYPYKSSAEQRIRAESPSERLRNRVWSLAKVELEVKEKSRKIDAGVVVGCENGEILLLRLRSEDRGKSFQHEWTFVARMSSPVKALTCRRVPELDRLRIVAGGADGAVVAWQELPQKDPKDGEARPRRRDYSSLWAFYEGEEISGLHLVHLPGEKESELVLALTRDEQCFLYNDRPKIADKEVGDRPSRIPVPGSRYGHLQRSRPEPPSAFASCLVPEAALPQPFRDKDRDLEEEPGTGRAAVLVTASKHGVVRVLSVHCPHFHPLRMEKYLQILRQWWRIVEGNHQLRLVHAVYRSAPSVELILVRWLLDPHWPPKEKVGPKATERPPQPWMLPRNLRSLLELATALKAAKEGNEEEAAKVYGRALDALREAFRLEDLRLYQEICEMLLRGGNFDLFKFAPRHDDPRRKAAAETYLSVFNAIEQSLPQWQGSTAQQERLARMTVAKNVVDGDTFLRVLDAASDGEMASEGAADRAPFRNVYIRRIRGVKDLLLKRDPRVSLEALRAANLSLQRLCKRLIERRNEKGNKKRKELVWEGIFELYFKELTAAAARVFRSPLELNDALAHGFARTFALAVCACPGAAMRIATRMTETQLIVDPNSPDDLCRLVPRQFQMLDQLGIPVKDYAQELFRIASRPPEQGLSPLDDKWLKKQDRRKLGEENQRDLRCLDLLYALVGWFDELDKNLSQHPERLTAWWRELPPHVEKILNDQDVKVLYRHSRDFWLWAVERFCQRLLTEESPAAARAIGEELAGLLGISTRREGGQPDKRSEGSDEQIQPGTVLLSQEIAAWAEKMMEALRQRYNELRIFQPEYTIFTRLFDRLQRSADAFPRSAAVRMNLVQGVLGHHLLEDLDEHILELQEIAHVLDPPMVYRYRREAGKPKTNAPDPLGSSAPMAQRFAKYLMGRSERAESLPKNLRTLFALLEGAPSAESPTIARLMMGFRGEGREIALGDKGAVPLSPEEYLSLRLILQELDRNARNHTPKNSQIVVTAKAGPDTKPILEFVHFFPVDSDEIEELLQLPAKPRFNLGRLLSLHRNGLQGPIEPRPNREVASSGMGLYMANFAAAIVQWKLEVDRPSVEPKGGRGRCVFRLVPLARPGSDSKGEA